MAKKHQIKVSEKNWTRLTTLARTLYEQDRVMFTGRHGIHIATFNDAVDYLFALARTCDSEKRRKTYLTSLWHDIAMQRILETPLHKKQED